MNKIEKNILLLAAIGLIISYYAVFFKLYKSNSKSYATHEFWFGMNETFVRILIIFQVLAAIGFITAISSWIKNPPNSGIMSIKYVLFVTLLIFFIGSIIWPFAVYYKKHIIVVGSVVFVALSSILLLAGSIEEKNSRWYVILGLLALCLVTVLADAILWNANYIIKLKD
jgi:uncharacterized membrane protein YesL